MLPHAFHSGSNGAFSIRGVKVNREAEDQNLHFSTELLPGEAELLLVLGVLLGQSLQLHQDGPK